jgi:hypothetical protein
MTVETGHHHVGDHEVGRKPDIGTHGKRFFAAAGRHDAVTATLEHTAGGGSHACLVIEQQNRRLAMRERLTGTGRRRARVYRAALG